MIKTVLFDFGGVLTPGGTAGAIERTLASIYGIDKARITLDDVHVKLRNGLITSDDFFAAQNKQHSDAVPVTAENFTSAAEIFGKSEPVYELAARLRTHGLRTGILSNIYQVSADELRKRGLYEGFDPIILSCEQHISKPDKEMYELAMQKLGELPGEILFVDDIERFLEPARELGMHTVLAVSPEQIVQDVTNTIEQENQVKL